MREKGPSPASARPEMTAAAPTSQTKKAPQLPKNLELKSVLSQIENVTIAGRKFQLIREIPSVDNPNEMRYSFEEERTDGKEKLSINITTWGLNDQPKEGSDDPDNQDGVLVRVDWPCPCMKNPLLGHDCDQQRKIAKETMKNYGRGMIVEINTEELAGNGYGRKYVWLQEKLRQEARLKGEEEPDMHAFTVGIGNEFDTRPHNVAAAVAASILNEKGYKKGIMVGSSPKKKEAMEKAGIKIIGNVHVVAHGRDRSKADQGYGDHDTQEEGVFIERKTPDGKTILVPLTKESMKSYMASLREARQTTEEQTVYSANQSRNQNTIYANQQMLAA